MLNSFKMSLSALRRLLKTIGTRILKYISIQSQPRTVKSNISSFIPNSTKKGK